MLALAPHINCISPLLQDSCANVRQLAMELLCSLGKIAGQIVPGSQCVLLPIFLHRI